MNTADYRASSAAVALDNHVSWFARVKLKQADLEVIKIKIVLAST